MKKVLAIDDNPKILFVLEKLIKSNFSDVEFLKAQSGQKGIELATEKTPNVILLDILMPEMNGYEVCKKIKANNITSNIPVVFLSSIENNQENRLKAIEAGADAFLVQPVENLELALQIKTMFKINSANIKNRNEKQHLAEQLDKHSRKLKAELSRRIEAEEALKESERRYRLLVENQNDLVVKFDNNRNMVYVSPNYCKCFGINESEIIGKKFFPLIHKNDLEAVKKSIDELEFPPHNSYHEERDKTVNGWRWFGWSKRAMLNDNGEIIEVIAVGRDITERKTAEKLLKKQEIELKDLNATKDKFFSIIAHDLRSPFNGVLGLSEMIYEQCENQQYDELLHLTGLLKKTANQSYELLNNLLEWSSTQSGRKKFNPQKLNLYRIFDDTVNLVSIGILEKNINIEVNCEKNLNVFADPEMLNTIMRNLLTNALKYSFQDGKISISAVIRSTDVLVAVKDTGIGINPKLQKKLFEIGENIITPGTNKEKGTGLGLILCKEFIEIHREKIWLESDVNKGTTFYFTLPINN